MTDFTITRRRLLPGLGTVGVASAGAGLSTTAYFSDQETFGNNRLTAGEFDLMVDWQVTYTGPNGFEYVTAYPDSYQNETPDTIATNRFGDRITGADDVRDPLFTRETIADNPFESAYADLTDAQREQVETAFRSQFADVPQDLDGPILDLDDVKPGDSGALSFSLHLFDNPGYIWLNGGLIEARENGVTGTEVVTVVG
jgi:predicted ribosomally synthesized peptide with SipW-like signal peptide